MAEKTVNGLSVGFRPLPDSTPDGPRLFEHFRDLQGAVRLPDFAASVRGLGFAADHLPSRAFQGTPMRHRGVHVGNFYLEKEGGEEFTGEDEELLLSTTARMGIRWQRTCALRDPVSRPTVAFPEPPTFRSNTSDLARVQFAQTPHSLGYRPAAPVSSSPCQHRMSEIQGDTSRVVRLVAEDAIDEPLILFRSNPLIR